MIERRARMEQAGRRKTGGDASWRSPVDQVEKKSLRPRIAALPEPEDGLLTEIAVRIVAGDVHQLVYRLRIASLREDEDELILNLGLSFHLVVEIHELPQVGAILPRPEERVFPGFDRELAIASEIDEPAHRIRRVCLRHCLNDA